MRFAVKEWLRRKWRAFTLTAFGRLVILFVTRMFHGGGEPGADDLDVGVGAILILLAMPGLLVSLLMFEKYGSLILFLRGMASVDRLKGVFPDEYFFLVLSMAVTGAAALWRWDRIFLDLRDYTNLVPLPISLRAIFLANLAAIGAFAALLTVMANAASAILFPVAVVGFQTPFAIFVRFALGHAVTVMSASLFSFAVVFAIAGLLMTLLRPAVFRRISSFARFLMGIWLLALLASSLTLPQLLVQIRPDTARKIRMVPPVCFMGLARTLWGRGDPFIGQMARAALLSVAAAAIVGVLAYALSFRRVFIRIPEAGDIGPLSRKRGSFSPFALLHKIILRTPAERAGYGFTARTLLRNEANLQVILSFVAIGLVVVAQDVSSTPHLRSVLTGKVPTLEVLSVPFTLSYSIIVGTRFAFEIPADLRANWVFKFWLNPEHHDARSIARRVLLIFSVGWLAPLTFLFTLLFWGWANAVLHVAIWTAFNLLLVKVVLIRFRKIPFTCAYPAFRSHSSLVVVAYLFGFFVFINYVPQLEQWALLSPMQTVWFVPFFGACFAALHQYRKQMLDMDKQLIFEEPSGY